MSTETMTDSEGCTDLAVRASDVALRSRARDLIAFCVKALVLLALLSFAKDCAPILPAFALPLVFLVYALPATIGSMYNIVVNRLHKQDLYNETGMLSHYNRRWFVWFGGFFVAYLASSLLFVLQAPSWDSKEWFLIWVSVPIFYVTFLVVQHICKKEYSVKYYKARAIKWSIVVSALLVTIFYALLAAQAPTEIQIDLNEIIQNRYLPFSDSPSPLLAEIEKLTTYGSCLTQYGVNQLEGISYLISFVVKLVLGFSVFAGIVSQLGACLLNRSEIESVFRLLPARNSDVKEAVQVKYFLILAGLWLALSGAFVWLNHVAKVAREASEYTVMDEWVSESSSWIILATQQDVEIVKKNIELVEDAHSFTESFAQKKKIFIEEHEPRLLDAVDNYYEDCKGHVDSYVEWYNSAPVVAAHFIPGLGEAVVRDGFEQQVIDPVGTENLNTRYSDFVSGLEDFYKEYWSSEPITELTQQAPVANAEGITSRLPDQLALWPSWDSEDGKKAIQEILLGKGENSSDDIRERILKFIDYRKSMVTASVESLPGEFNLEVQQSE